MQSFIVNIHSNKKSIFFDLMDELNFEILEMDEQPDEDDELSFLTESFIINIPDSKKSFFLELMNKLDFGVLDMDEQSANNDETKERHDSFLDWEEERKAVKKSRRKG